MERVHGDQVKRRDEKEAINRRILEEMVHEARRSGLEPIFVLFYVNAELQMESWRERLLKDVLGDLGVRYVDSKRIFLAASTCQGRALSPRRFYFLPGNGHVNGEGYRLIASELAGLLRSSGDSRPVVRADRR